MKVTFPKRMSKKTAIDLSIKHWQRMILWAKKQKQNDKPDPDIMRESLGENRLTDSCALCQKYNHACYECPLGEKCGICGDLFNRETPYRGVADSTTWGYWAKNAQKMLKVLEGLKGVSK